MDETTNPDTCETCRFGKIDEVMSDGTRLIVLCRRFPQHIQKWPHEWCGEFMASVPSASTLMPAGEACIHGVAMDTYCRQCNNLAYLGIGRLPAGSPLGTKQQTKPKGETDD